jgi:maltokinase
LLHRWLPQQRWFAGKGSPLEGVEVVHAVELVPGEARLVHVLARCHRAQGDELYQLLLGIRTELPERLAPAVIGRLSEAEVVYDAAHDGELTGWLLERFLVQGSVGGLSFNRRPALSLSPDLRGRTIGAEQSNTSIVFGDKTILKLFRRIIPGVNPDLEVSLALADAGSQFIPEPLAWFSAEVDGETTTLGMLQEFLSTGADGWELAKASVRDAASGDFTAESDRLGAATADVHNDLARSLPTAFAGPSELSALAAHMTDRLNKAAHSVPALAPYAERLRGAYTDLAELGHTIPVQRIHGDFHLGQVMRTTRRWVLIDFEGEPGRPLAERRALHSPLRDVAAMLRSYDYAARHQASPHAEEWAARNREAFCAGYAKAGGIDPRTEPVLLRAFETDKAVYEVVYEHDNRPGWLPVPLDAVRRLAH